MDLVEAGRPVAEIAERLGVTGQTIHNWRHQDLVDHGIRPGVSTAESVELAAARRRIRELETDLAVTKRANELLRVPANAFNDDHYRHSVEQVFPRWLRFAGERCGLSEDLIAVSLATARAALEGTSANSVERYGDTLAPPATSTLTELLADGVDYHDPDAVHDWLENHYSHFDHRCR